MHAVYVEVEMEAAPSQADLDRLASSWTRAPAVMWRKAKLTCGLAARHFSSVLPGSHPPVDWLRTAASSPRGRVSASEATTASRAASALGDNDWILLDELLASTFAPDQADQVPRFRSGTCATAALGSSTGPERPRRAGSTWCSASPLPDPHEDGSHGQRVRATGRCGRRWRGRRVTAVSRERREVR